MKKKKILTIIGIIVLIISLIALVSACGGGKSGSTDTDSGTSGSTDTGGDTDTGSSDSGDDEDNGDTVEPSPTPEPASLFPEVLALHPEAFDIEVSVASGTYVYLVPGMVKETVEYLLAEQEALGWEKLGNPTVMGHLATLTMKMGDDRLTVSMQDNELSESTRVQMLLMQQ
jgi:hypothetical protein